MPPKEMKLGVWAAEAQQYRLGSGHTLPKEWGAGLVILQFWVPGRCGAHRLKC